MEVHGLQNCPALLPITQQLDQLGLWIFPLLGTFPGEVGHVQSLRKVSTCLKSQMENEEVWIGGSYVKETFFAQVQSIFKLLLTFTCQCIEVKFIHLNSNYHTLKDEMQQFECQTCKIHHLNLEAIFTKVNVKIRGEKSNVTFLKCKM